MCLLFMYSFFFFEFYLVADSYDIGFGLFFEWTKSATEQQVSVHVSDSEDTEDDDADEDNGKKRLYAYCIETFLSLDCC